MIWQHEALQVGAAFEVRVVFQRDSSGTVAMIPSRNQTADYWRGGGVFLQRIHHSSDGTWSPKERYRKFKGSFRGVAASHFGDQKETDFRLAKALWLLGWEQLEFLAEEYRFRPIAHECIEWRLAFEERLQALLRSCPREGL
jgi:hypothetical protein